MTARDDHDSAAHRPQLKAIAPTPGAIDGGAAKLLAQLVRSCLPGREKDLVLHLINETYGTPAQERYMCGDPDWYWLPFNASELAAFFGDQTPNISTRVARLGSAGVLLLDRAPSGFTRRIAVASRWPDVLFDRERARALHSRDGAGAPAYVRQRAPGTPLAERAADAHGRQMLASTDVPERWWPFIEHFQSIADEAFQIDWLAFLDDAAEFFDSTALAKILTNVIGYYHSRDRRKLIYPWGAFRKAVLEKISQAQQSRAAIRAAASVEGATGAINGRRARTRSGPAEQTAAAASVSDSESAAGAASERPGLRAAEPATTNSERVERGLERGRGYVERGRNLVAARKARAAQSQSPAGAEHE